MRVLVCGGRDYDDYKRLNYILDAFHRKHGITVLIQGGARGADALADQWGKSKGIPVINIDANWDFYKKRAGPIRNQWMLDFATPDVILAFPGKIGTPDMVERGEKANVTIHKIDWS